MGKFVLGNCNVSLRSCANRKKESERVNRASGESRHSLAPRDMGQGSPGRRYGGLSTPAWGPKPGHALPDQADAGVLMASGPVDGTKTIILLGTAEPPASKRNRTWVVSSPVAPEATPFGNNAHWKGRSWPL